MNDDKNLALALQQLDEPSLTDWETEFVHSIAEKVIVKGWTLTPKQRRVANDLLREHAGDGAATAKTSLASSAAPPPPQREEEDPDF